MHLDTDGINKLIAREGFKTKAYKDTKGIWTIGVGHTGPEVTSTLQWSSDQVMIAFRHDVGWAEDAVNEINTSLTQNQFNALVSLVFNIGATAFRKSTMRRKLVAGDVQGAGKEFDKWHIPKEIISRRNSEKEQFCASN